MKNGKKNELGQFTVIPQLKEMIKSLSERRRNDEHRGRIMADHCLGTERKEMSSAVTRRMTINSVYSTLLSHPETKRVSVLLR